MRSARTLPVGGVVAIVIGLVAAPAVQANTACESDVDSGQGIKNNAVSAQNRSARLDAKVYCSSGYRSAVDILTPSSGWFQLKNTYDENASFLRA